MKLENQILKYLPLLAPVPTAWLVGVATYTVLHFPVPVAFIAAVIIEGLGFVAINTAIQMREFNSRLTADEVKQKMHAPVGQAYAATVLYILVAAAMTVLLHVFPGLVAWASIPFILMTVAGAWLYALRADFDELVKERDAGRAKIKQEKADAKEQRKMAKQQGVQPASKQQVQVAGKGSKLQGASSKQGEQLARKPGRLQPATSKQPVQDEALLAHWSVNPKASDEEVAEQFGKSRQAIQQRRNKLINRGEIRMTDKGIEIVGINVSMQTTEHK
jgi:hypothetical protein